MKINSSATFMCLLMSLFTSTHAANITVDATTGVIDANDGECSLSEAIEAANTGTAFNECIYNADNDQSTTIILTTDIVLNEIIDTDQNFGDTGTTAVESTIIIDGQDNGQNNGTNYSISRNSNLVCSFTGTNDPLFRLMRVAVGGDLSLTNVTLSNGCAEANLPSFPFGGGGAVYNSGTLSLQDVEIKDNESAGSGGGVFNAGNIGSVENSRFENNLADRSGGAIFVDRDDSLGMITNSQFISNSAGVNSSGGAIFLYTDASLSDISGSYFKDNTASVGGGIFSRTSNFTINNSTFADNKANTGSKQGGAIYMSFGDIPINNSTFSGNSAGVGGAFFNKQGSLEFNNSTFAYNSATSQSGGGVVYLEKFVSSAEINNSLFLGNDSDCERDIGTFSGANEDLTTSNQYINMMLKRNYYRDALLPYDHHFTIIQNELLNSSFEQHKTKKPGK